MRDPSLLMHGLPKRGLAVLVFATSLGGVSCGGPGSSGGGCHYESWQGRCKLQGVRTSRIVERFPKSYVVIESTYEPTSSSGVFAPPPFRKETLTPAEFELDLTNHLKQFAEVDCAVDSPVGDPCAPKMHAAVPEFVPAATTAATGPVGCGKIEHSGGTVEVPSTVSLPGPFQFGDGTAEATPEVRALADEAARAILQNSRIECVAIKGQSAPGEPFSLANDRAQAVRRLLESRGVDHTKVTIFESSAPTYTASPDDQPVLAEHRRVHLAVVVYGGESAPH
jgi:outer membrane protein OmpA-like peptidoglycan-associated protein